MENTDSGVIESLYRYKMSDLAEFEEESRAVTKEHRMGVLDPTREATKYERQIRYKKRREMLLGKNKNLF